MNKKPMKGDLLLRKKGAVLHIGVFFSSEEVAHIQPNSKLRTSSLAEFAQGEAIKIIRRNRPDYPAMMARFHELSAKASPYSVFFNNCEHNANYVLSGTKESQQLQSFVVGAGLGALLGKKHGARGIMLGGLIGGMAGVTLYNGSRNYL